MRTAGIVAAFILLFGGLYLAVISSRASQRVTITRLRRVLATDERNVSDDERPPLALLWSELGRAAEGIGQRAGIGQRLDGLLSRADLAIRPGEFVVGVIGATLLAGVVGALLVSLPLGLLAAIATPLALVLYVSRRASSLVGRLEAQLPDALDQLASSMRSGYSLGQAIEAAVDLTPKPLGPELGRAISETRVGRTLDEALESMAARVGSTDLSWTVRALQIQTRTGGAVADILETLAEFMREREEVRREIKVLTADGRISAVFLLGIPFVVAGMLIAIRPEYLSPLVTTSLGRIMVVGALVLMAVGTVMIRNIVKVEV